jgi:hypothetical protein
MTLPALLTALRSQDATLYIGEDCALRYAGPQLPADSLICATIVTHKAMLVELFTHTPSGRCVGVGCYRLKAAGKDICPWPYLLLGDLEVGQNEALAPSRCRRQAA